MTSWMAERDRLLAQADALVKKGASTVRPSPSSSVSEKPHDRPLTPQPRPASSAPAPYSPPVTHVSPSRARSFNEGEADHQPLTFRRNLRSDAQPTETIPIPMLATSERDDIEIRVSRFRAQQTKMAMEREAHYERMQSVIKSQLSKNSD